MIKNSQPDKRLYHTCNLCDFSSRNKGDYNKHLSSKKHQLRIKNQINDNKMVKNDNKMIINDNKMVTEKKFTCYVCACGREFKFPSGLSRHKQSCITNDATTCVTNESIESTNQVKSDETFESGILSKLLDFQAQTMQENKDFQIQTVQNNQEFQTMMLNMFKECMQNTNKTTEMFAEALPNMGNINSNNNTITNNNNINYYLNVTCKDAETDLEFLEQWKERCIEMFHEKKLLMAERKISFPNMCTDAYFKQIRSKPQAQRFIQTTNWKDGRVYVNTAKLDEDKNPTGETEFILHEDGLQKVNNYMSHALGQSILQLANKEVEENYFEENRKFNIFSMQPTTPEIEWKRDMTGGLMIGTSEVFNVVCSSTARTKIMKETAKCKYL